MKTGKLVFLAVGLLIGHASANYASIGNITIDPAQPLTTDFISLNISGGATSGESHIVSSLFQQNENQLSLDLTIDMGLTTVLSFWSHTEQIGTLDFDTYFLTVRLLYPEALWEPELQDTHQIEFAVTPEPATLLLLTAGIVGVRHRYRQDKIAPKNTRRSTDKKRIE